MEDSSDHRHDEKSSFWMTVIQGLSKLLLVVGGLIFFLGDRALREFWRVPFGMAIVAGIGAGVAVMLAGAALQLLLPEAKRIKTRKSRGHSRD
jgi:hypothetical protein